MKKRYDLGYIKTVLFVHYMDLTNNSCVFLNNAIVILFINKKKFYWSKQYGFFKLNLHMGEISPAH